MAQLTEKGLKARGLITAEPIQELVARWCLENTDPHKLAGGFNSLLGHVGTLAGLTGLGESFFAKLLSGKKRYVKFDTADKIVCCLYDAYEWVRNPDLNDIYESFDYAALDRSKPCVGGA